MFSQQTIALIQACSGIRLKEPAIGIEQGAVPIGCVKDVDGNVIGSVEKVIVYNEDGTFKESVIEATMFGPPASTISPYDGEIWDCNEKFFTTETGLFHRVTCEYHKLVRCYENGVQVKSFLENPDGTTTESYDMSEFAPAVTSPSASKEITLQSEVVDFALADAFDGTIDDAAAAAIAAAAPEFTLPDGTTQAATTAELVAYKVTAMPCDSCFLATPGDLSTETVVLVDKTFINDNKVRSDGDSDFAAVNLASTVVQAAGGRSVWCFQFELKGDLAKDGTFTPAA